MTYIRPELARIDTRLPKMTRPRVDLEARSYESDTQRKESPRKARKLPYKVISRGIKVELEIDFQL